MNYRHAYHAGNFADVFKHIILARVLTYAMRKDAALRYIDTHAGIGLYDLRGDEAQKTGEWQDGIARLLDFSFSQAVQDLCAPYLAAVHDDARAMLYPGSPLIAKRLLRRQDRLTLCEWHKQDITLLQQAMGRDRRLKALHIDGYMALNAYVPPIEKRGIVLIDPPFEVRDEFDQIITAFAKAYNKWPQGNYLIWYPIKSLDRVRDFYRDLSMLVRDDALAVELWVDDLSDGPLSATGIVVINPPYILRDELSILMPELLACLGRGAGARQELINLGHTEG
jgi:23S rRNA (adenine2030-N6)-methyltransferase